MTNMVILTDAEYDQLTPVEKIDYWRRRFYAMEEDRNFYRDAVAKQVAKEIRLRAVLDQA